MSKQDWKFIGWMLASIPITLIIVAIYAGIVLQIWRVL